MKAKRVIKEERIKDHEGIFYRAGLEIKDGSITHKIWTEGEELRLTKEDALLDCETLAFDNDLILI